MPVLILEEANYQGPIPEDTILPAKLIGIKEKKAHYKNDDGSDAFSFDFSFVVEDPDSEWDGTRVWGETSKKFVNHPDCRLYAWAQEILATELPPGFALDTDALAGNHCRVVIGNRKYEKDGTEKVAVFVRDVMRSRDGAVFAAISEDEPF